MRQKFNELEKKLNEKYYERKEEIRGLMVALLSRQHVLLLGAPGTAKSALAHDVCCAIGGKYFKLLVSRTTTPEELFGPVSLKALENDSYRRMTKERLPEADIAFLDEVWKCNSSVLNGMLGVLNEREYVNDGQTVKCPLEFCVGASNEMPEDMNELGALWDRFMLRYVVKYVKDPSNFEKMLSQPDNPLNISISRDELKNAQAEAGYVDVTKLIPRVFELRYKLEEKNITASDRRWKTSIGLLKANAWLEGRREALEDDLEILSHSLWQDPEQRIQVRQIIMQMANPLDQEALELYDEAEEIFQSLLTAPEENVIPLCQEGLAKFKKIEKRLKKLLEQAKSTGKSDARINGILEKIAARSSEIVDKHLKISLGN